MAFGKRVAQRPAVAVARPALATAPAVAIDDDMPRQAPAIDLRIPVLSLVIILILFAVFWVEQAYPVSPGHGYEPSLRTIVALGGASRELVLGGGEWWRVFTAPLLHGDLTHILSNCFCLFFAARYLELIAGRAWLGALFVIGGLAGTAFSLAMNPPQIVTVGASGAIMGLLAALFVLSFDNQVVKNTSRMQRITLFLLIPSLLPAASGSHIDVSAHIGGALAGALAGFFLQATWDEKRGAPSFRQVGSMLGLGGAGVAAFALLMVSTHYTSSAAMAQSIPELQLMSEEDFPNDPGEADQKSAEYIRKYPDDPRAHFFRALFFMRTEDMTSAQGELRTALAERQVLEQLPERFTKTLHLMLAATLVQQGRLDDAKATAAPACDLDAGGSELYDLMKGLRAMGVCPERDSG
jgi:rhomboid protease GluP